MYTWLALLGHLLTAPSNKLAVAEVEDIPMLIEGLMREIYKPDIALNQKYWSREHLFWDALIVGIGFPIWMGLNQAQAWDKYPNYPILCLRHFKEDYAEEYMAACVLLLTMTCHLKAAVSKHYKF